MSLAQEHWEDFLEGLSRRADMSAGERRNTLEYTEYLSSGRWHGFRLSP